MCAVLTTLARRGLALGALAAAIAALLLVSDSPDIRAGAATGKPIILAVPGTDLLYADMSRVSDDDALPHSGNVGSFITYDKFTYQWIRIDANDNSETNLGSASTSATSYRLTAADVGHMIKVTVTFTDKASNAESVTSVPYGPIADPTELGPTRPPRTLVGNTTQSDIAAATVTSEYRLGFRLGSHGQGYEINSVTIDLAAAPSSLTVSLWRAGIPQFPQAGSRNYKQFEFINPDTIEAGLNTFTAPDGAFAFQNVNYFIVLSDYGDSLSINETSSDDEDPGGEAGAIIYNSASVGSGSRGSVLRMTINGSSRDSGILASNFAVPIKEKTGGGHQQEVISVGDDYSWLVTFGDADRYLVRGFIVNGDDTGVKNGWCNPFRVVADSTRLFDMANTDNTEGLGSWTAPQGSTVEGNKSHTISHGTLENSGSNPRQCAILNRFQLVQGMMYDTPGEPGAVYANGGASVNLEGGMPPIAVLGEPLHEMVSNFGQTDAGYRSVTSTNRFATNGFTTGSNALGYTFKGVDVNVEGSNSNVPDGRTSVKVSVYTANSTADPDQHLFDLINPDEYKAGRTFFEAPRGATLEPNTEYVLVWEHLGGTDHRLRRTKANAEDAGALAGFSIRNTFKHGTALNNLNFDGDGHSLEFALYGEAITITPAPSVVPGEPHVAAGGYHSCMLDLGGNIDCVGRNDEGQLNVPPLDDAQSWTMVSAGEFHTCALVDDGTVQCWGDDAFDQVTNTPAEMNFVALDAGPWHTCALTDVGGFVCWGRNDDGQLANGALLDHAQGMETEGVSPPRRGKKMEANFGKIDWITPPVAGATVLMVSAGGSVLADDREANTSHSYTCVLWSTGEIGCAGMTGPQWDRAWHGIKSDGGSDESPSYRCNLQTDSGVVAGTDDDRCAPGDPLRFRVLNVPELDSGLYYTSVAVGGKHACATVSDGSIRCWGSRNAGAIGFPQTDNSQVISERYGTNTGMAYGTPEPPVGYRWRSVACGQYHTCAVAEPLGGGLAGSGESEQPDDGLDYTVFEGFTLHADDNVSVGMWSDGETLWTLDRGEQKVYAYHLRDDPSTEANEYGTRDESKEFGVLNDSIQSLTGDGTYLWVTEQSRRDALDAGHSLCNVGEACTYGYPLDSLTLYNTFIHSDSSVSPAVGPTFSLASASDGRRLFIGNTGGTAYIYSIWDDPGTAESEFGKSLGTVTFTNSILSLYTDGEVLWAGSTSGNTVEVRRISDGARMTDLEFSFPSTVTRIDGLWSNGVTFFGLSKPGGMVTSTVFTHRIRHRATPHGMVGATGSGGSSVIGDVLRADTSSITDGDGLPQPFSPDYQWQRDTGGGWVDIAGATSVSYTVREVDDGARLRVVASFTDNAGFDEVLNGPWSRVGAATDRLICWGNELYLQRNNPNYPAARSNPAASPARDNARLPSVGSWHSCWLHGTDGDPRVTCLGDQDFNQSKWRRWPLTAPETLVANVDQTLAGVPRHFANAALATSFTTGANRAGYAITSVAFNVHNDLNDTGGLEVSLWSHLDTDEPWPNRKLATFTIPAKLSAGVSRLHIPGGYRLSHSKTYWIVVHADNRAPIFKSTFATSEDSDSQAGFTLGDKLATFSGYPTGPLDWWRNGETSESLLPISLEGHVLPSANVSAEQNLGPQALTLGPIKAKLVAEFEDVPTVHDGSGAFTVRLTFSDDVTISAENLKDHAIKVTGGAITAVTRSADEPKRQFALTVQPSSNDSVSLFTSPTSDCTAAGALCTEDGRRLSIYQAILISGPPDALDTGLPAITGPTVMGQTLTADISAISDDDGLTNPSLSYQWVRKSDDAQSDIAGATGATYTLSEEDVGQRIRVRVRYNDDAGNSHSLTSAETARVTKPRLGSVELIDGTETTAVVEVTLRGSIGAAIPIYVGYKTHAPDAEWTIFAGKTDSTTGKAVVTLTDLTERTPYNLRASMNRELDPFLFDTFVAGQTAAKEIDDTEYLEGNPAAPGTPTFERGDGSLTISWDPPPDNGTAPVRLYQIEIRNEAQTFEQGGFYTLSPEDVPYTIEQLANGVTYYVRVSAGNSTEIVDGRYVVGPASDEASAVPGTGTVGLGTPIISSYEKPHHRMLKLDWQDIENADWYEVQFHHPTASQWVSLPYGEIAIAQHGSSAVLSNLNVGFLWFVRVRALGCGGPSEWSEIQQILSTSESDFAELPVPVIAPGDTRPESSGQCPPGTPILAEPTHPKHLAMTLHWQDVEGATSYEVQYHHPDGNRWVTLPHGDITVSFDGSSAVLENLHDGLLWFVRVRSVNAAGESAWSEILQSFSTSADDFEANEPDADEDALSATFGDAPASHDGATAFTVELTFTENIKMGFQAMRDDVLSVTGGTVTRARRLTQGSNIRWEITIQPTGAADIAISLPATTDCTAAGAVCTHEGAMLTTAVGLSVEGPGS